MKRPRQFHHLEFRCYTAALLIAIAAGSFASTAAAQNGENANRPPNMWRANNNPNRVLAANRKLMMRIPGDPENSPCTMALVKQ